MTDFNAWKAISYVEIVYFVLVGIVSVHLILKLMKHHYSFRPFIFLVAILVISKVLAGVCCVVLLSLKTEKVGLAIAYIILNTIAVGFFLRLQLLMLVYINDRFAQGEEEEEEEETKRDPASGYQYKPPFHVQQQGDSSSVFNQPLTDPEEKKVSDFELPKVENMIKRMVPIGVILCAVGAGVSSSSGGNENVTKDGIIVLKAGTIIYAVTTIGTAIALIYKLNYNSKSANRKKELKTMLLLQLAIIPLILVRVIYSICSAFTFTSYLGSDASAFSQLYGSWEIYLGMGFIEECLVMALIVILGEFIVHTDTASI